LTVDGTNAHRGAYSLHAHVNALSDGLYLTSEIMEKTSLPTLVYIRAWFWLSALPGPDNDVLEQLSSKANNQSASGGVGFSGAGYYIAGMQNTGGYDYRHDSATKFPLGAWTCIEIEVDTSYAPPNPNGVLQVWHDSPTADGVMGGGAELQPLVAAFFGFEFTAPTGSPSTAIDVYVDDIAIDTQYIDCNQ
jgi:hypothetical protein